MIRWRHRRCRLWEEQRAPIRGRRVGLRQNRTSGVLSQAPRGTDARTAHRTVSTSHSREEKRLLELRVCLVQHPILIRLRNSPVIQKRRPSWGASIDLQRLLRAGLACEDKEIRRFHENGANTRSQSRTFPVRSKFSRRCAGLPIPTPPDRVMLVASVCRAATARSRQQAPALDRRCNQVRIQRFDQVARMMRSRDRFQSARNQSIRFFTSIRW